MVWLFYHVFTGERYLDLLANLWQLLTIVYCLCGLPFDLQVHVLMVCVNGRLPDP